jgi:outer membrane protein assembly factor BamB
MSKVKSLDLEWTFAAKRGPFKIKPIFYKHKGDNFLIATSYLADIYAVDLTTGNLVWKKINNNKIKTRILSRGVVHDGVFYVILEYWKPKYFTRNFYTEYEIIGLSLSGGKKVASLKINKNLIRDFPYSLSHSHSELLLLGNSLFFNISNGSEGLPSPFSGAVFKVNINNSKLKLDKTFFTSREKIGGSIWSKSPPAVSENFQNIFLTTGSCNGDSKYFANKLGNSYCDSVISLDAKELNLKGYYMPSSNFYLDDTDSDLCTSPFRVSLKKNNNLVGVLGKTNGLWLVDTNFNSSYYFPLKAKGCSHPVVIVNPKRSEFDIFAHGDDGRGTFELKKYIINYNNKTHKLAWTIDDVDPSKVIMGFSDKNRHTYLSFFLKSKKNKDSKTLAVFSADSGKPIFSVDIQNGSIQDYVYASPYYFDRNLVFIAENKVYLYKLN